MCKDTDIKVVMGKNIASARKKLGYSQEKFAELVSISLSTLSKIETGSNMPKPATLKKIISNLELDLHELFINNDVTLKKDVYLKHFYDSLTMNQYINKNMKVYTQMF